MLPSKKKKFTNTILLSNHRIRYNFETKDSRTTKVFPDCNSISYNIEAVHEQLENSILLRKNWAWDFRKETDLIVHFEEMTA